MKRVLMPIVFTGYLVVAAVATPGLPAQNHSSDVRAAIGSARMAVKKLAETRQIISKEQRDWELRRESSLTRKELLVREIAAYRDRIAEAKAGLSQAEEKRSKLVAEKEVLAASSVEMTEKVKLLEARVLQLLDRLPEPHLALVKPRSQRIPQPDTEVGLSVGERFQNVVTVLTQIHRFQSEININEERRLLADGNTVAVTTVYLGISQGYYVSAGGEAAGVGLVGSEGWVWTPAPELAPRVASMIAILQGEQVAEFVSLPVRIQGGAR